MPTWWNEEEILAWMIEEGMLGSWQDIQGDAPGANKAERNFDQGLQSKAGGWVQLLKRAP